MAKTPTDERILIQRVRNHAEYKSGLVDLGLVADLPTYDGRVADVTIAWLRLGIEHLDDAQSALSAVRARTVYSRAYYAIYNASKAVRYRVKGAVSLTGDDHQKAGELPDDFPNVAMWTALIAEMYKHRLRADYDNWRNTAAEHSLSLNDCVAHAVAFIDECKAYLDAKFGLKP